MGKMLLSRRVLLYILVKLHSGSEQYIKANLIKIFLIHSNEQGYVRGLDFYLVMMVQAFYVGGIWINCRLQPFGASFEISVIPNVK
jgi:hypothetical protein